MKEKAKKQQLVVDQKENQFELEVEGEKAFIEFVIRDNKIHLTHTEVPFDLQGNGIGSVLVEKALQYIKKNNLVLVPSCSFVANYVNNNPEWHSLLSEGYQM